MNKNLIVKISQGLGNQLFMYSNAYALSKKIGYNLLIDNTSSYYKNKDQYRNFLLDKFDLDLNIAEKKFKRDNFFLNSKFKYLKIIDYYKKKKFFFF